MASSTTIVAALKFQGGVVIGADSQASDIVGQVRWPVDKLDQLPGGHPCVLGVAGSTGRADQARHLLAAKPLFANQFKKRELVQGAIMSTLMPLFKDVKEGNPNPPTSALWQITVAGLAAFSAADEPQILELEFNGDSCFHDYFHAIGSGTDTAYAIYNTLGGRRLAELDEPKALLAMIRIIRTCVNVEMWGVSEPLWFWVVRPDGTRRVSKDELQPHIQLVDRWEESERDAFFNDRWELS